MSDKENLIRTSLTGNVLGDISKSTSFTFKASDHTEMIRIASDGFYVRGVKLEQNEAEARKLFDALLEFIQRSNITHHLSGGKR